MVAGLEMGALAELAAKQIAVLDKLLDGSGRPVPGGISKPAVTGIRQFFFQSYNAWKDSVSWSALCLRIFPSDLALFLPFCLCLCLTLTCSPSRSLSLRCYSCLPETLH